MRLFLCLNRKGWHNGGNLHIAIWYTTTNTMLDCTLTMYIYNMLCHIFAAWIMFPTKITILKSTLTCIFSICYFIYATNWLFTTKLTMLVDSPIMYIFNYFYYWTYNVDRYHNMYIVVPMFHSICSVISARYGLCFLQKSQSW